MPTAPTASVPPEYTILVPFLVAFVLGLILFPPYIKWLKHKQIEQYLREEGPASHAGKARTPTMGGVCFIIATVLAMFGWWLSTLKAHTDGIIVLVTGVLCAAVGFADDFAKVSNKSNKGVSGKLRLAIEAVLGLLLAIALIYAAGGEAVAAQVSRLVIFVNATEGFTAQISHNLPIPLFCLLSMFLIMATTNAVNLHDGMDGLAAGTSSLVFATMAVLLFETKQFAYASIAAAAAGAVISFLIFNKHPAKIFMGDTGSLFIGGLMGALVVAGGLTFWFVPLSIIYIMESISVMQQVAYFKLTKPFTPEKPMSLLMVTWTKLTKKLPGEGKRLYRMAPLHHHFEAVLAEKGYSEAKVVRLFWIAQFILCFSVLLFFYALRS